MPRVVPSLVVGLIDEMVRTAKRLEAGGRNLAGTGGLQGPADIAAIVDLASQIPTELLPADPRRYMDFSVALATYRIVQKVWETQGVEAAGREMGRVAGPALTLMRGALAGLPDAAAPPSTAGLEFLDDLPLRDVLRLDISHADSALRNGEWKAATVLSGSIVEALLLWSVRRHTHGDRDAAASRVPARGHLKHSPAGDPEKWHLPEYVAVAAELGCISEDTRAAAWLTKNYRNLIHPGAAARAGAECNLGTAHIAVGTVDRVARDLERQGVNGSCP